ARAISNSGWVVGPSRTVSGAVHAVRWGGGQITDLGVLPGDSRAFGLYVNDGGEVAGQSYGGGYEHAFEWDHGVMRAPAAASRCGSWNCSCSVDPSIAVTDDRPLVAICVTSSKYPTPTNSWWRTAA